MFVLFFEILRLNVLSEEYIQRMARVRLDQYHTDHDYLELRTVVSFLFFLVLLQRINFFPLWHGHG